MRRWGLLALLVTGLLTPAPAAAQSYGPAHHFSAVVGPAWGASTLRAAYNRRLLVIINGSANVVFCTVDGTDAARDTGWHLAAQGTTGDRLLFDRQVPQGPVRCYCANAACGYLLIEGR